MLLGVTTMLLLFVQVLPACAATNVSVTSYGAVANDGADDTAAFQRAVDAAANGVLTIPAGRYDIGQVIVTHPTEIKGEGDASLLRLRNGVNNTMLTIRKTRNVYIHDLQIDGNLTGQTGGYPHGIQFDGTTDSTATRLFVHDCEKSGVNMFVGADRITATDSRFADNENDVEVHSSAYCYVAGNYAERTQYESWVSYEQAYGPGLAHHNTIVNNVSKDAYAGINVQRTHDCVIKGNTVVNAQWGIMVEAQNDSPYSYNNVVEGNTLTGGANSTDYAINVEAPSHGDRVIGNTVTGWHETPLRVTEPGAVFEGNTFRNCDKAAQVTANDCTFTNNTFSGSGDSGIIISTPLSGLTFSGNTIENSAREGIIVIDTLKNSAFLRNTIRGNGKEAPRTLDGLEAIKVWTSCAVIGNRIGDDGTATQLRAMWLQSGSTVAVANNTLTGNVNSPHYCSGTSGASVTVAGSLADSGVWKCTTAGTPGTWAKAATTTTPTPAPAPAPTTRRRFTHPTTKLTMRALRTPITHRVAR
jgi:parallel beta-helix repeat protein